MRLDGGFTQNKVYQFGDKVEKYGETVGAEFYWYLSMPKQHIPANLNFSPGELGMDFVESAGPIDLNAVFEIVEQYKSFEKLNNHEWPVYIDRIRFHVAQSPISNGEKLIKELEKITLEPTFAHGDLSVNNIIQSKTGPKLIDPLYFNNFGSYLLDYAKLAFSLKFYNEDLAGFEKVKAQANVPFFDVLVASECVRVATYNRKFDFIAENLINEL